MKSSELALSAMYRILKKAGAERVSEESAIELRNILEKIAIDISVSAVDVLKEKRNQNKSVKRVTLSGEDVNDSWKSRIKESGMDRFRTT